MVYHFNLKIIHLVLLIYYSLILVLVVESEVFSGVIPADVRQPNRSSMFGIHSGLIQADNRTTPNILVLSSKPNNSFEQIDPNLVFPYFSSLGRSAQGFNNSSAVSLSRQPVLPKGILRRNITRVSSTPGRKSGSLRVGNAITSSNNKPPGHDTYVPPQGSNKGRWLPESDFY